MRYTNRRILYYGRISVSCDDESGLITFRTPVVFQCCLCVVQVETVADTYMVSCGVPVLNRYHASELAMMALSLRNSVSLYKVFVSRSADALRWRGDATGRALDLRSTGRGFKSYSGQILRNNLGQVVHTYVSLSSSSITWCRPRGGDALWLGR